MTKDVSILICMPVTIGEPGVPSKEVMCHLCKEPLWCSETMYPAVGRAEVLATCWDCAEGISQTADTQLATLHPRQIEAMTKDGTLPIFQRILKIMNASMPK